jgi:hypothetical protein
LAKVVLKRKTSQFPAPDGAADKAFGNDINENGFRTVSFGFRYL